MTSFSSASALRSASAEELAHARAMLEGERRRVATLTLFARRMSHDMSNYVTVVRTYSELLLADLPASGMAREDVQEVYRAAEGMVEYMERIGHFARAAAARPSSLQLDETVSEIVKGHILASRITPDLASQATIRMDAIWLSDALNELLTNSFEASPLDSMVQLSSRLEVLNTAAIDGGVPIEAGAWAVIEIADVGPGMPEDMRQRAFDPYVTTKMAERGGGFGLTVAQSAAWQAGGQLVLGAHDADRPGMQVRLWLPCEQGSVHA